MIRFIKALIKIKLSVLNAVILFFSEKPEKTSSFETNELNEIREKSRSLTDINDHLVFLYEESMIMKPDLIVELGVRGGESTFVFERVASLNNCPLVSVDLEPTDYSCEYQNWHFVQADDIQFADSFESFCKDREIPSTIDVLFIDTSHHYEHTKMEIEKWFPLLSQHCIVFFHDTCMKYLFRRSDGTFGGGWKNNRAVIRAVEEYFGVSFNEYKSFQASYRGFNIVHNPLCSGLTMLKR